MFGDQAKGDDIALFNEEKPSSEFTAFVKRLKEEIAKCQTKPVAQNSLPDQIRRLTALHEEGILTAEEFTKAKGTLISGGKITNPIGFN